MGSSGGPILRGGSVRQKFKACPLGYFHSDPTEVRTEEGKFQPFVAIDRTSMFAFA
jgi:hypothetical protein